MVVVVAFIGVAGSGKTSLVKAYGDWLVREHFQRVARVNLDPGAENVPYRAVFDIRRYFTIRDIMVKYGLGPNGAFIKAGELIADMVDEIMMEPPFRDPTRYDYILLDTPGQMEAFIFRPASSRFFEKLLDIANTVGIYVIDASAIHGFADAVTLWFLGILTQVKLGFTIIPIINKIDAAGDVEVVKMLIERPEDLEKRAEEEAEIGILSDIAPELIRLALKTRQALRPIEVSATRGTGLEDLHFLVHEAFCTCGDLT